MKNFIKGKLRSHNDGAFPVSVSHGMHVETGRARTIYIIMLSVMPLLGLFGSVFTFITACESKGVVIISKSFAAWITLGAYLLFGVIFGLRRRFPALSRGLSAAAVGGLGIFAAIKFQLIVRGFRFIINGFMSAAFSKYENKSFYALTEVFFYNGKYYHSDYCIKLAAVCVIGVMAFAVCSFILKPNVLIFVCATFPLPELCLYFGLVPETVYFVILTAGWCGAAAADIARLGIFSDKGAERIFTKTAAQSCIAAAVIMLASFGGAELYVNSINFKRPDSVKDFRNGVVIYMRDFSWDKFKRDVKEAIAPDSGRLTHDGKLGNTDSVEFTGKNMLEVTLPSDCNGLYLRGFTGTDYTGSRWEKGKPLPALETNISSPEFFSARVLRHFDGFSSLRAQNVIIRNTGISSSVKYYPENAAGLLETDGVRRRYGVYFPENGWRSVIISEAQDISLDKTMAADELKMRDYAYANCLDVPETFTAYSDFFEGFEGGDVNDTLRFIRKGLSERCEYVLDSGKKPFGTDFAQWFLTENHKGSCTHFASAAALLCRSMGIPARYCEGFVIKDEDIGDFPSNEGFTTVSVPDSRAHAWAEVYIDGFGWLPFEATPGYGNMALELDYENDGFEGNDDSFGNAPASEITSVTTESPVFSEAPAASEVTSGDTEITVTESSDDTANVSGETENMSAESGNGGNVSEAGYETAETVTSVSYVNGGQAETGGTGTSAKATESGSAVSDGGDTDNEISPRKELPKGVWVTGIVIIGISAVITAVVIYRKASFASRRKRLEQSPDRAAAHIYRTLLRISGEENVPEELPARLCEKGVPEDITEVIVMTAMKARFGGGIDADEARASAGALEKAIAVLNGDKVKMIPFITAADRYIGGESGGKDA